MNLLFSISNSYLVHCLVAISSALKQAPKELEINIYLFSLSLRRESLQALYSLCATRSNTYLHPITIEHSDIISFPMPPGKDIAHISVESYFRLFAANYLPLSLSKIIYLDSDIVVNGSLVDLWEVNLDGYPCAAVYQLDRPVWDYCKRLMIDPESGYFNAGVLVINLDLWRRESVLDGFRETAIALGDSLHYHDQDILNKYFTNRVLPLDLRWNLMPFFFSRYVLTLIKNGINSRFAKLPNYPWPASLAEISSPSVIHFASSSKPWNKRRPSFFSYLYWRERSEIQNLEWTPTLMLFYFASRVKTLIALLAIKIYSYSSVFFGK